jgi:hypothetical protein
LTAIWLPAFSSSEFAFRDGDRHFLFFRAGEAQDGLAGADHLAGIGQHHGDDAADDRCSACRKLPGCR